MTRQAKSSSGGNGKSSSAKSGSGTRGAAAPLDVEDLAKSVLLALDMWRVPVDPFAIAKEEGIDLAPGRYGPGFDARIKFVRSVETFILFYREVQYGLTEG